jgi:hypothetical protein
MPPTVFMSLNASLAEPHEAAVRSLFALRRFGILGEANSQSEALVKACVTEQLSQLVAEHHPRLVITSLNFADVQRTQMRDHMNFLGLEIVGKNLAEPWSTQAEQSKTRAEEILTWLANHACADDAYAVIDMEGFGTGIPGTVLAKQTVLIDSERRKLSGLAFAVGVALSSGSLGFQHA